MKVEAVVVLFVVAAIFGLVGVIVVDIMLTAQQAEAKGCPNSVAANASKGRCVDPGPD